jgi:glycine/D-amino acid oxidase-like deaminating enzyme
VLVQREMERGRSPLVSIPPFGSRNPGDEPNVYIARGDSGAGLTHGTIAGMLVRDLILGRDNAWTSPYDPSRKSLRAALTFAEDVDHR